MNNVIQRFLAFLQVVIFMICFSTPHMSKGQSSPKCSMYGLFTYIWVVLGENVGKYTVPYIEHWLEFPVVSYVSNVSFNVWT